MTKREDESPETPSDKRPFEQALIKGLGLESHDVRKVELRIGPRSQSAIVKIALTLAQVAALDAMVNGDQAEGKEQP